MDNAIPGIRLAAAGAGIRYSGRDDLVLLEINAGSRTAAVFTRNAFCAAPVQVAREHLAATQPRYLLINAGNANAGTGANGLSAARETCRYVAAAADCTADQVLPFSTGVIGEDLPTRPFAKVIPKLFDDLSATGWERAALAIMTTDTVPKLVSRSLTLRGKTLRVTGIAKGAGMICPDMATMLSFIATDIGAAASLLQTLLAEAVDSSFNAITVDGDTSTNDACVLVATGQSGIRLDNENSEGIAAFRGVLQDVCRELARAIVRDGEGATKLVTVAVAEAASVEEAKRVAYTVAHSPLVKTALFAADPNWGRILAAVGRAGLPGLNIGRVRIWLDDVCIVQEGSRDPDYRESAGQAVMAQDALTVRIELGRGTASTILLTCDLSFDYVKINAEYRT